MGEAGDFLAVKDGVSSREGKARSGENPWGEGEGEGEGANDKKSLG